MKSRKILVTSALPYANGSIHIGHVLESVITDIWVRYQNINGNECLYFCADDTHGTPVMLKAKELGIDPEELIKRTREEHIKSYSRFNINFDNFYTTHSDENKKYAEDIYQKCKEGNLIFKKEIEQFYDSEEGLFLSDRFIKGTCPKCGAEDQYGDGCSVCGTTYTPDDLLNPVSSLSNSELTKKRTEHVFFDLPQMKDFLENYLKDLTLQDPIKNKLNEWIEDGLKPWDISRDKPYFGFEIPGEKDKYFYVWLDAPIGYLASAKNWAENNNMDMKDLWGESSDYEIHHFIGKDIAYFHALFWPALLKSSNIRLPESINVHGFLTIDGEKMSKSNGTFINADDFAENYDGELLRYYFADKFNNSIDDLDFNEDEFIQKINSDIVGKYLNIASRVSKFIEKNGNNLSANLDVDFIEKNLSMIDEVIEHYENLNLSKSVKIIMKMADEVNKYINENEPWKSSEEKAVEVSSTAINCFRVISILLNPVLPTITSKALEVFNDSATNDFNNIKDYLVDTKINPYKPLLKRLEKAKINEEIEMEDSNLINIKDFAKVELRVAKIVKAEGIEEADKLIKLHLDVGDLGERTVFAGIKSAYDPESLNGRHVVLVANLEPRKMKFGVSEGMVLASSNDEGSIYLISPDEGAKPGQLVK
jgi:methionyl-tRNA synthetase|tara:strand:- start:1910 stop:3859 length:1950 start_codon:yes stop_codon:yes gene_type:complete